MEDEESKMKRLSTLAAVILTAGILATTAFGQTADKADSSTTSKPKALKPQTVCPVMGGKIDSSSYTDIQGQRVYHCCGGCKARLKADPDKYFKKAAEDGVLFENIQKSCPVTGTPVSKKSFTDYVGRRIYFCSDSCKTAFAKDPQGYLAKMDKPEATTPEN